MISTCIKLVLMIEAVESKEIVVECKIWFTRR